jgi:hypothetical protein
MGRMNLPGSSQLPGRLAAVTYDNLVDLLAHAEVMG